MITRLKFEKIIYWTIFIFIVGCFCFILSVFPVCDDDFWVLAEIKEYGLFGCLRHRFYHDNTRLGNIIGIPLTLVPKWISNIITSFSFILGFWLMMKVCNLKTYQWKSLALLSFLVWVAPMWEDGFFSHMYAFNYIVPIPLLFGSIYIFINPIKLPYWIIFLLGFLLGIWHESFAIIFISGAIFNFFINKSYFTKHNIFLIISVSIGLLWIFLTPALYFRQSHHYFSLQGFYRLGYIWIYFIFLILWFYYYKNKKSLATNPLQIFALSSCVLFPLVILTTLARASFPGILISCCAFTVLCHNIVKNKFICLKRLIALFLFSITFISLITVCLTTLRVKNMEEKWLEISSISPQRYNYAFSDILYPWEQPKISLRRPDVQLLLHGKRNWGFMWVYTKHNIFIVPNEFRHFSNELGKEVPSNSNILIYNGRLVSTNLNDTAAHFANINYGFREEYTKIESTIFRTEEGKDFVYLLPIRSSFSTYLGNPKSIELKK